MEFRRNSDINQAAAVFDIFIHKQIESAEADEGGRQSGEISAARRNGPCRNRRRAGRDAEKRSPGETIRARVPKELSDKRRNLASAAGSIVKHRINQQLKQDRNFAAIARGNGELRRMAAAGAFSAYGDAFAIHAELFGTFVEPAQRRVIVFERSR